MNRPAIRSVFLGTPEAAVASLVGLSNVTDVLAVITRPDKPRGRSGRPMPSPAKVAAAELGIAVLQPANANDLTASLRAIGSIDLGVVTAYGMLIRPEALAIPSRGFLNVHFSLLPRWRGANPVVAALLAGDEETGLTIMHLDEGLDTGPIVAARSVVIGSDETAGELTGRLATAGAELLTDNIVDWVDGNTLTTPQPSIGATHAAKLTKADLILDLSDSAENLTRRIRALAPKPGAVLSLADLRLQVLAGRSIGRNAPPGQIDVVDDRVLVGTSKGTLELLIVQPPDKRPMAAAAWMRGLRTPPGVIGD